MFLDAGHVFSLDVGGFILFPGASIKVFASDANGFPAIARPYINTVGGELRAEQSAFNPFFSGSTTVDSTTQPVRIRGERPVQRLPGDELEGRLPDRLPHGPARRDPERSATSSSPIPGGPNILTFLGRCPSTRRVP